MDDHFAGDTPNTGTDSHSELAARLGRLAGLHARAAARRAEAFVADHDAEIRTAGLAAAQLATSRVANPILRPVLHAVTAELAKGTHPAKDASEPGNGTSGR